MTWPWNLFQALPVRCLPACAAGLMMGCGSLPVRFDYPRLPPNLKVEAHNQTRTNRLCRGKGEQRHDDGSLVMNGTDIAGCFIRPALIVISAWYPNTIYHELCHASGRSARACAEVQW